MTRKTINDYVFYKIANVNGDIDLCYVGSTVNIKERRRNHVSNCYNENSNRYNLKLYKTIREYGGWCEFKMIEIARVEQLTLTEAHQIEEGFRVELKSTMNTNKCYTTAEQYRIDNADKSKQYRIDNNEKLKQYDKQYRIDNADKRKQYRIDNNEKLKQYDKQYKIDNADKMKEKYTCDCGGKYTLSNISRHHKSNKHQKYIQSLTPDI